MRQPRDSLRPWLRDWARWHIGTRRSGYSDATVLHRAQFGYADLPPKSSIPDGVVPPRGLEDLIWGMSELLESPSTAHPVWVMRSFYLLGAKRAAAQHGIRESRVYQLRETGEMMLRAWLKARGIA